MISMLQRLILVMLFYLPTALFANVNVVVKGVKHDNGFIKVRIYLDSNAWLQEDQQAEQVIAKSSRRKVIVPLKIFHGGTVATMIYHDENGGGKLNTGLFWRPKDGFAFSNNYTPQGSTEIRQPRCQHSGRQRS